MPPHALPDAGLAGLEESVEKRATNTTPPNPLAVRRLRARFYAAIPPRLRVIVRVAVIKSMKVPVLETVQ